MALSAAQLDAATRAYIRLLSRDNDPNPCVKATVRQAMADIDGWADANAASFNSALNVTFRTAATSPQKAIAFAMICMWRAGRPLAEGQ